MKNQGKNGKKGQSQSQIHNNNPQTCVIQQPVTQTTLQNMSTTMTDVLGQSRELLYGTTLTAGSFPNQNEMINGQQNQNQSSPNLLMRHEQGHTVTGIHTTNTGQYNGHYNAQVMPPTGNFNSIGMQAQYNAQTNNGTGLDNNIPPWAIGLCQQMTNIQSLLDGHTKRWQMVENHIAMQCEKMIKMESQISEIPSINQKILNTNTVVNQVQSEIKQLQNTITEYDDTVQLYSNMYDDITSNNIDSDKKLKNIEKRLQALEEQSQHMNKLIRDTDDKVTDVRWRTMRENLLFFGVPEVENFSENGENCEARIKQIIKSEMKIEKDIPMDRVHRIGRYNNRNLRPRPIVVKFTYFKDRELVRLTATTTLIDTSYGVSEQFPPEIEEKRKPLYEAAKKARLNKDNTVRLVRDKLYINGELFIPNDNNNKTNKTLNNSEINGTRRKTTYYDPNEMKTYKRPQNNNNYAQSETRDQRYNTNFGQRSRTFKRTIFNNRNIQPERTSSVQLSNKFGVLSEYTPSTRPSYAGKKKATSPLENDLFPKKQHFDSSDSDSERESLMDLTQEPQNTQHSPSLLLQVNPPATIEAPSHQLLNMTLQTSPVIIVPPRENSRISLSDCNNSPVTVRDQPINGTQD